MRSWHSPACGSTRWRIYLLADNGGAENVFITANLFGQAVLPGAVATAHHVEKEGLVGVDALEVEASAQEQVLPDRPFESAVRGFDVTKGRKSLRDSSAPMS